MAIDLVSVVIGDLIRFGRVRRGYIGISGADIRLPRRALSRLNLAENRAVHVIKVEANSPAARAGIAEGNVLLAWEGRPVTGVAALARLLDSETIGKAVVNPTANTTKPVTGAQLSLRSLSDASQAASSSTGATKSASASSGATVNEGAPGTKASNAPPSARKTG